MQGNLSVTKRRIKPRSASQSTLPVRRRPPDVGSGSPGPRRVEGSAFAARETGVVRRGCTAAPSTPSRDGGVGGASAINTRGTLGRWKSASVRSSGRSTVAVACWLFVYQGWQELAIAFGNEHFVPPCAVKRRGTMDLCAEASRHCGPVHRSRRGNGVPCCGAAIRTQK